MAGCLLGKENALPLSFIMCGEGWCKFLCVREVGAFLGGNEVSNINAVFKVLLPDIF